MREISIHVGKRIRLFRKARNLTIEAFAKKINKSKATVSKYENGDIVLDVEMLFQIAQALNVSVGQLVNIEKSESMNEIEEVEEMEKSQGLDIERLYLYYYDGRSKSIIKNVIVIQSEMDDGAQAAVFYANIKDYKRLQDCKYLFHGTVHKYDTFTNFSFVNQNNQVEHVFIYAINSFGPNMRTMGLFSGLLLQPMMPTSFKCILSPVIEKNEEVLKTQLLLGKEDIKNLKKLNMFVVDRNI